MHGWDKCGGFVSRRHIHACSLICLLLPPFQVIRLSSSAHIHIDVNEYRHNIYMNVDNSRKSYNMKQRK